MSLPLNPNDPRTHSLAQAIELAKAAQATANALQAEREAEKVREALTEANSKTFDKAQSYTTVIIAGAYVGMFSIFSSSKDVLSPKGSTAIALCLTLSLTFFVLYEVAGIALRTFGFLQFRRDLSGAKSLADLGDLIKRQQAKEAKAGLRFVPLYALSLALTLLPALVAAGLLIFNNVAKLIGFHSWPT